MSVTSIQTVQQKLEKGERPELWGGGSCWRMEVKIPVCSTGFSIFPEFWKIKNSGWGGRVCVEGKSVRARGPGLPGFVCPNCGRPGSPGSVRGLRLLVTACQGSSVLQPQVPFQPQTALCRFIWASEQ